MFVTPNTMNPTRRKSEKPQETGLTSQQLDLLVPFLIQNGIADSSSVDYVTQQISHLVKENPMAAKQAGIPNSYVAIKLIVQKLYRQADLAKDPGVTNEYENQLADGKLLYTPVDGNLFVYGVAADDIKQRDIGDCFFAASLSAVAEANPKFLEESIVDNGNGMYSVRFFNKQGKPFYVTVDGDLPHDVNGSLIYDGSPNKKELWVAIMEKAYAKLNKSYEQIGKGGQTQNALYTLTGIKADRKKLSSFSSPEKLYSALEKALKKGDPVVADTYSDKERYDGTGLVERHSYTVLQVKTINGQEYVLLRNPWAYREWGETTTMVQLPDGRYIPKINIPDGKGDGIFMMPIGDFQKLYQDVSISRSQPKAYSEQTLDLLREYDPNFDSAAGDIKYL